MVFGQVAKGRLLSFYAPPSYGSCLGLLFVNAPHCFTDFNLWPNGMEHIFACYQISHFYNVGWSFVVLFNLSWIEWDQDIGNRV
jgi:hypothetical protein